MHIFKTLWGLFYLILLVKVVSTVQTNFHRGSRVQCTRTSAEEGLARRSVGRTSDLKLELY